MAAHNARWKCIIDEPHSGKSDLAFSSNALFNKTGNRACWEQSLCPWHCLFSCRSFCGGRSQVSRQDCCMTIFGAPQVLPPQGGRNSVRRWQGARSMSYKNWKVAISFRHMGSLPEAEIWSRNMKHLAAILLMSHISYLTRHTEVTLESIHNGRLGGVCVW